MPKKTKRGGTPQSRAALRNLRRYAREKGLNPYQLAAHSGLQYRSVWTWLNFDNCDHRLNKNSIEQINNFLEGRPVRHEEQTELPLDVPDESKKYLTDEEVSELMQAADEEIDALRHEAKEREYVIDGYRKGRLQ